MKTNIRMTDEQFWMVVTSERFKRKFWGRCAPLDPANGGTDFYCAENIDRLILENENYLKQIDGKGHPMRAHALRQIIKNFHDWKTQIEWIHQNHLYEIND